MATVDLRPLTKAERKVLATKLRTRSLSTQVHQRYRVIAEVRSGCSLRAAADRVGITPETASRWVYRFNASGFGSFEAVPNPRGRIPIVTRKQILGLIDIALSDPRTLGLPFTVWSVRTLTEYCREKKLIPPFSEEWIRRILHREGFSPKRIRTWKTSSDPRFLAKKGASARSTSGAPRARRSSASTSGARSN